MQQARLGVVLQLDDRASAGLVNVANRAQAIGPALRRAMPSLATFGNSLASILITMGALDSQMGRNITMALSFASAISGIIGPLQAVNAALRTNAALQAFITSIRLPGAGLAVTALAGAAAASTAGFLAGRRFNDRSGTVVNVDARGATFASEQVLNDLFRTAQRQMR